MAINKEYIATGGVDGRVMLWASATAVLKNNIEVIPPDEVISREIYIFDMVFLTNGLLLVSFNSG